MTVLMPMSDLPAVFLARRPVVPADVWFLIVHLLPRHRDRRALLLSCKELAAIVLPLLYRSLELFFPSREFDFDPYQEHQSFRILNGLICSMSSATRLEARCNAQFLVTLAYTSDSLRTNFRSLPMLADVLRACMRLRHLTIDVPTQSVPLFLEILRRTGLMITPTHPAIGPMNALMARRAYLPNLESVRSTALAVVDAFMRYRSIETVVLEVIPTDLTFAKFLRPSPQWNPSTLRRFSFAFCGARWSSNVPHAIFTTFPSLEYFAVRCGINTAPFVFNVSIRGLVRVTSTYSLKISVLGVHSVRKRPPRPALAHLRGEPRHTVGRGPGGTH